jgi:hypothetical protein
MLHALNLNFSALLLIFSTAAVLIIFIVLQEEPLEVTTIKDELSEEIKTEEYELAEQLVS